MSLARCAVVARGPRLLSLATLLLAPGVTAACRSISVFVPQTRSSAVPSSLPKMYTAEERGSAYSPDYRVYFRDASGPISPLHDIPLWANKAERLVNMVVEVPRWSNAKMELSLSEPLNPIKQDVKKGALRFVANVFPHHGYIWNYGALPQTWENPSHVDPATQARGDNDPIDVIEIGTRVANRGDVVPVKILGTLALIDEGETDWKLIAIDSRDALASSLQDVGDVEKVFPGLLKATVEWFKLYKVPDGKPQNQFAFDAEAKDKEFAYKVIEEVHAFWRELVSGNVTDANDINKMNVSVAGSPGQAERAEAAAVLAKAPPKSLPQAPPATGQSLVYTMNVSVAGSPGQAERAEAAAVLAKAPPKSLPQAPPATGQSLVYTMNVSVAGSPGQAERAEAAAVLAKAPPKSLPQAPPATVDKWHFLANL